MIRAMAAIAVAGCYSPASEAPCHVTCLDGVCPGALACGGDQMCHAPGAPDCNAQDAGTDAGDDAGDDATADAKLIDAPPSFPCYGSAEVVVCLPAMPAGSPMFGTTRLINTDDTSGGDCVQAQTTTGLDVCVISGINVTVSGTLHGIGARPLVVIGTSGITISGTLSVASASSPLLLTGAGAPACAGGDGDGNNGGAGGSHASVGGAGGSGGNGGNPGTVHGYPSPLAAVAGGCAGGRGGGAGAAGGKGGGVLYLISPQSITVMSTGVLDASGAPGAGGPGESDAGGGGGAGGYIGIDALSPDLQGLMRATGAGGGGGGSMTLGGSAGLGISGCAAPGGPASNGAGNGGAGSSSATAPGLDGGSTSGVAAGGGGGGAGVIVVHGTTNPGGISCPSATIFPQ